MEAMSINGKSILRLEFFLAVIWILQSAFLLGDWLLIFVFAKK